MEGKLAGKGHGCGFTFGGAFFTTPGEKKAGFAKFSVKKIFRGKIKLLHAAIYNKICLLLWVIIFT
jgi:hypothetical protein